ncbi:MAG: RluA family pseudouridine synthase [Thermoguttaceae bacterium]|jgi:23S rRNA pseudouridine1911/1915/1917 synthase
MSLTPDSAGGPPLRPVEFCVAEPEAGLRLDVLLTIHFHDYSRAHLRRVISAGGVTIDGKGGKPAYHVRAGQRVCFLPPEIPRQAPRPEAIPLDILYEDEDLVVVNKPPGMVVHPARGHWSGTLAGALQFHFGPGLSQSGGPLRPGIVHRLDRDTSGVILVARSDAAHARLAAQFQARSIEKEYFALVAGRPDRDRDVVDRSIAVHPLHREKMATVRDRSAGRTAETFYEVIERFDGFAALRVLPKTGRTHQIRVHLAHAGFPVLCDRQYGGRAEITRGEIRRDPQDGLVLLNRQALHARRVRLVHPRSGQPLEIEAPMPADMAGVLAELREYR